MKKDGFTVLEMVVVLGIVTIISSVVLANYPAFNERLGVRRAAEDVASSIRQVQAYGLGVKEFGPGSGIFPGYGIYFWRPAASYILYADRNNNLQYDAPGEKISELPIQGAAVIDDIRSEESGESWFQQFQQVSVKMPCRISPDHYARM